MLLPTGADICRQKYATNNETEQWLPTAAALCSWANPLWCWRTLTRTLTKEPEGWTAGKGKSCSLLSSLSIAVTTTSPSLRYSGLARLDSICVILRKVHVPLASLLPCSIQRSLWFILPFYLSYLPFLFNLVPPSKFCISLFLYQLTHSLLSFCSVPFFCCLLSRLPGRHSIVSGFFPFSKKKLKNLCPFVPARGGVC